MNFSRNVSSCWSDTISSSNTRRNAFRKKLLLIHFVWLENSLRKWAYNIYCGIISGLSTWCLIIKPIGLYKVDGLKFCSSWYLHWISLDSSPDLRSMSSIPSTVIWLPYRQPAAPLSFYRTDRNSP